MLLQVERFSCVKREWVDARPAHMSRRYKNTVGGSESTTSTTTQKLGTGFSKSEENSQHFSE